MKLAILQPGYLPWLGFFEQMARTDLFVYYNDVQYTRKDWRNRNRVKTTGGATWLTVPVRKTPRDTPINHVEVCYRDPWPDKHLRTIELAYKKARHFQPFFSQLTAVLTRRFALLQELNAALVDLCRSFLDISTPIAWSSDLHIDVRDKNDRILKICQSHGADLLYDGKSSRTFLDTEFFARHGVRVMFQHYRHTPYRQLWRDFVPFLSAVDLIMNTGPRAKEILLQSSAPSPEDCSDISASAGTSNEPE